MADQTCLGATTDTVGSTEDNHSDHSESSSSSTHSVRLIPVRTPESFLAQFRRPSVDRLPDSLSPPPTQSGAHSPQTDSEVSFRGIGRGRGRRKPRIPDLEMPKPGVREPTIPIYEVPVMPHPPSPAISIISTDGTRSKEYPSRGPVSLAVETQSSYEHEFLPLTGGPTYYHSLDEPTRKPKPPEPTTIRTVGFAQPPTSDDRQMDRLSVPPQPPVLTRSPLSAVVKSPTLVRKLPKLRRPSIVTFTRRTNDSSECMNGMRSAIPSVTHLIVMSTVMTMMQRIANDYLTNITHHSLLKLAQDYHTRDHHVRV
jgi:hypothetical protein